MRSPAEISEARGQGYFHYAKKSELTTLASGKGASTPLSINMSPLRVSTYAALLAAGGPLVRRDYAALFEKNDVANLLRSGLRRAVQDRPGAGAGTKLAFAAQFGAQG